MKSTGKGNQTKIKYFRRGGWIDVKLGVTQLLPHLLDHSLGRLNVVWV
jgi:hypothetical protein